jgi:hypothetical protein
MEHQDRDRPCQAGDDEADRVDEVQAEDQRQFHQGDRVDLAPERKVDTEHHARPEQRRKEWPWQMKGTVRLREAPERPDEERGRD